ncbi:MAG: D-aminoacyl-tRNA deacylase [Myxococcota bacterium]|nr:D-aminoacyl-tRNA deacylase [Myxococcota bacterium]
MRIVLQRVSRASVTVDKTVTGAIEQGFLALVGVGQEDDERDVDYLVEKTAGLRVFVDDAGKMNRSVVDVEGDVLAVSQFTLYGDCRKGRRPSFVAAMAPERANQLFERYVAGLRAKGLSTPTGVFGAHMDVDLLNDGPVTLLLCSKKSF